MVVPLPFKQIWVADFEFNGGPGERPRPVCLVARELRSGNTLRVWEDELLLRGEPPYPTGPDVLFIAYYASAELGCHLALGWPMPENTLDLFTEFRVVTNGLTTPCGNSLLGALTYFGLDAMDAADKDEMRQLALRGGPWTPQEVANLLDYCESDVKALVRLLPAMLLRIDLVRGLVRGRYMKAVALMENAGVPIDTVALSKLQRSWSDIEPRLIESVDREFQVFDGTTFKQDRWGSWLFARGIPWPRTEQNRLKLDDDTFKDMEKLYPAVAPIRALLQLRSKLRLNELAVGADGRNRCLLSPFRSKTGRNQPSNSKFIFGPAAWMRGLIKPPQGHALAYIDWSQQEWGIVAALSGDPKMIDAYVSGDPYLTFGKQAGVIPAHGTKESHEDQRALFKECALAVGYGMGAESLALKIGRPPPYGRELLDLHRRTYPIFWRWSDAAVDYGMLHNRIHTVLGWTMRVGTDTKPTTLMNFPGQANGAEMLRLACCLATEAGITVCAPVHDALLIMASVDDIETAVATTQDAMRRASAIILGGFELRSDPKIVRFPDRYMDEKRGRTMWEKVWAVVRQMGVEGPMQ